MENDYQIFMFNVVYLRKLHGLSKRQMAKVMGIGVKSLNKIERGEFPPRLKINVILDTCRFFQIKPAILLSKQLDSNKP